MLKGPSQRSTPAPTSRDPDQAVNTCHRPASCPSHRAANSAPRLAASTAEQTRTVTGSSVMPSSYPTRDWCRFRLLGGHYVSGELPSTHERAAVSTTCTASATSSGRTPAGDVGGSDDFQRGRPFGLYAAVSLVQQQPLAFGLSPAASGSTAGTRSTCSTSSRVPFPSDGAEPWAVPSPESR